MILFNSRFSSSISIKNRLLLWLLIPVILILAFTGHITYRISRHFISISLERMVMLQTMALSHEIEAFLERCKKNLLMLAQNRSDPAGMRRFLANMKTISEISYCHISYISQKDQNHIFLAADGDEIFQIPSDDISDIIPNPFMFYEHIKDFQPNDVWLSGIAKSEYPFPNPSDPNRKLMTRVISFVTPYYGAGKNSSGYLILSVDVRYIRNILSAFNSPQSPVWFPRTDELRYSYMFDKDGWILFQSEEYENPDKELTTDIARSAYTGTMGNPDLTSAFRPSAMFTQYWKMIEDIRENKRDVVELEDSEYYYKGMKDYYLAYTPIHFSPGNTVKPYVYSGIAHIDRSSLTIGAGYKQMDVMFVITISAIILVSLVIYFLSYVITKPILKLTEAVNMIQKTGNLEEIRLSAEGYETSLLQNAINSMIGTMKRQIEEIRKKDKEIERLILKDNMLEAAGADARETGTGKQLTAEDENLLSDTLFGHVKDIRLDIREPVNLHVQKQKINVSQVGIKMNRRQEKAYPRIVKKGGVTRSEYQKMIGDDLPSRTALNDLQDLVKKGILSKTGHGPATRYVPS